MHFHRISDGIVSHRLAMSWREDGPAAFAIWHIDLPTASSDLFGISVFFAKLLAFSFMHSGLS
jgi:hypothetical protein